MSSDSERCTGNGGPGAFIRLEGAGLRFRRYADSVPTLKQTLLNRVRGIRRTHAEEFWIYRDLDLHISSGEAVGIMGANGAGKSTLLKLIAGIYTPSLGRVHVRGSVVPMMELGASLHPELTGLENIGLMGALMGKSRQVMHRRAEDI